MTMPALSGPPVSHGAVASLPVTVDYPSALALCQMAMVQD